MDLINRDEKVIAGIEKIRFFPVAPIRRRWMLYNRRKWKTTP